MYKYRYLNPAALIAPHRVTHPERVNMLMISMRLSGWRGAPLVGYAHNGAIQLLTGTHRLAAAMRMGMDVPVLLRSYSDVEKAYGDVGSWKRLILEW